MKQIAAIGAVGLLAACGGHAGSALPAVGGSSQAHATRGTLQLKVPAKATSVKRPAYISYATQSVTLTYKIGSTTYPTQTLNVSPWDNPGDCKADQNNNFICTLTFDAVAGAATFTVSAYDQPNAGGKLLSTATSSMTIVSGKDNQFDVTLDGVLGGFNVAFTTSQSYPSIPVGTPADVPVVISATDPDNGVILDASQPIDANGNAVTSASVTLTGDPVEFSLEQNGTALTPTSGSTYTIALPATGLSLHYNGGPYGDVALTVGAGSATGQGQLHVEPTITEFAPLSGVKLLDAGHNLVVGPDGNVWFTEQLYNGIGVGKVASDGTVTEYPLQNNVIPAGIASANGKLWISEAGNCPSSDLNLCGIQEMQTDGTVIGRFDVYHGSCDPYPGALVTDKAGNVWYDNAACGEIGYLAANAPSTEQHFEVGSTGFGFTAGADGNVWFIASEAYASFSVGKISSSGAAQTYAIPQAGTGYTPASLASRPIDNSIWVAHQGDSLDALAPGSGAVSTYSNDLNHAVLATGSDGNVYAYSYSGSNGYAFDSVGQDGTIVAAYIYGGLAPQSIPYAMIAGPAGTNTFWFIDGQTGEIAKLSLGVNPKL
ncbi:MAG TPA: hypothetical protein VFL13_04105 [Candidatus Baltobacteraceae bacterium]|nr:hypothetical protein [Candidatus Baltobacteraceae bacterium]